MFSSIRIILFLLCLGLRWFYRPIWRQDGFIKPWQRFVWLRKNKGKVLGWRIAVKLPMPFRFRLDRETAFDQFLKRFGLAWEFQTGCKIFDRTVYIACDHPGLHQALEAQRDLRRQILELMRVYEHVGSDGKLLWLERSASEPPESRDYAKLEKLASEMNSTLPTMRQTATPFLARVLACEAILLIVLCYSGAGLLASLSREIGHLDNWQLIWRGLIFTCLLGMGVVGLWRCFLGKSAWSARLLGGNWWLLGLATPVAGVLLFGDLNMSLDEAPSTETTAPVEGTSSTTRRRKGRDRTTYYLHLGSPEVRAMKLANGAVMPELPRKIAVSQSMKERADARPGQKLVFVVKPGWWGVPWCERYSLR